MASTTNRKETRRNVHERIRKRLTGTTARPRLAVHFSNKHVYAQIIDDERSHTLVSASTHDENVGVDKANVETAAKVGASIAAKAKAANITTVVFDRGGFIYHGKVKALADAAREAGLIF